MDTGPGATVFRLVLSQLTPGATASASNRMFARGATQATATTSGAATKRSHVLESHGVIAECTRWSRVLLKYGYSFCVANNARE